MMPDANMPKVGDRIKVIVAPHMANHDEGVVRQALHGALGIEFDAMPGEVHHWYVPAEVMVIEAAAMPVMDEGYSETNAARLVSPGGDECRMLLCPVEVRTENDEGSTLEGYGARFNEWAQIGPKAWGFQERIAPGAFAASIKEDDIRSFFNHDSCHVLGRNTTKTLTLNEDAKGLHVVIRPPDTQAARDVVTLIKRGDVNGMSFMFRVRKDQWDDPDGEDDMPKRTLLDVKLIEVGPVSMPAYPQTSIAARDQAKALVEAYVARTRGASSADIAAAEEQARQQAAVLTADSDRGRRLRLVQAGR